MPEPRSRSSWGMRFTERYLLRFFGPPEIGADRAGRAASTDESAREHELRTELERVVGPDGRTYLVPRDPTGAP